VLYLLFYVANKFFSLFLSLQQTVIDTKSPSLNGTDVYKLVFIIEMDVLSICLTLTYLVVFIGTVDRLR